MTEITRTVADLLASVEPKEARMTDLSALLLKLKETNRDAYARLKTIKREVQQERQKFDEKSIALQSVQYQRQHLESEIQSCHTQETRYEKIELVSMDEFSCGQSMELEEHELMLARLQDELARRKSMMDEVKLAEIRKDAEKDKLAKLKKELESLRDNAKTIYKMATSYKLVTQPTSTTSAMLSKQESTKQPLQKLYEEVQAWIGEREATWAIQLYSGNSEADEVEEEGLITAEDGEEDEGEVEEDSTAKSTRHHSNLTAKKQLLYDHAYLEIVPPSDIFNGTITINHTSPDDTTSPLVVVVHRKGLESSAAFLEDLELDASLKLCVESPEGTVAYKWIQVAAGLDSDMAFADSQRCLASFFAALPTAKARQDPSPSTDNLMEIDDSIKNE